MDIKQRLARIQFLTIKPDLSHLSPHIEAAVRSSANAVNVMTDIYLKQLAHGNVELLEALKIRSDEEGRDLLRYFMLCGCGWDEFDNNKPFIPGLGEAPKFGSFYPLDLTKEEWDEHIAKHPSMRADLESERTVIKRVNGELSATPYSIEYGEQLKAAAKHLEDAALKLSPGKLQDFIHARTRALLGHEDYLDSDMLWVDTDANPFELIIGPYETYFDGLNGQKTAFEGFVGLPDMEATKNLQRFAPAAQAFGIELAERLGTSAPGGYSPMAVVHDVMRGGEMLFGDVFVACNLPNDPRVHKAKGSKNVFSRTMMEAKFNAFMRPAAQRFLPNELADRCTFDSRMLFVLGHELAHGVGPNKANAGGREVSLRDALGNLYSPIEEAKADTVSIQLLCHFAQQGLIGADDVLTIAACSVAGFFRSWRKGFVTAHDKANLIQYNWLCETHAIEFNKLTGKYDVNPERCAAAMSRLATALMAIQMAGDYDIAQRFMERWSESPKELTTVISGLEDLPLTVSPIFEL